MARRWGQNLVVDGSWYTKDDALALLVYYAFAGTTSLAATRVPGVANTNVVDSYELRVLEILRKITTGSSVGRLLITLINASPRTLRIVPVGLNQSKYTRALPVACLPTACAGGATDSLLRFEPIAWGNTPTATIDPGKHFRSDDVLLHEMFHALRQMRGLFAATPMGEAFHFVEEFYAIMVTNMYVSEVGRPESRRADHLLPFDRLYEKPTGPFVDTDVDFFIRHKAEVDAMIKQMPDFCAPLGEINNPLPWNPIKKAWNHEKLYGI